MIAAVSVIEAIYRAARPWQAGANGDTNSRAGGPPPPSPIAGGDLALEVLGSPGYGRIPGDCEIRKE